MSSFSWLKLGGQLVILDSFLEQDRQLAGLAIRMKAPLFGADPEALSLEHLAARLDSVQLRRLHFGVYSVLSGHRPRADQGASAQTVAPRPWDLR